MTEGVVVLAGDEDRAFERRASAAGDSASTSPTLESLRTPSARLGGEGFRFVQHLRTCGKAAAEEGLTVIPAGSVTTAFLRSDRADRLGWQNLHH